MKMRSSNLAAIALALAVFGCATASQPKPQPTEKVLARTNAGDRMSHFVGCGITETGQAADAFRITTSVLSDVTAAGDGWQIDTRLDAHADDLASSKARIASQSKGTLEEKLNGLVAKRLGS